MQGERELELTTNVNFQKWIGSYVALKEGTELEYNPTDSFQIELGAAGVYHAISGVERFGYRREGNSRAFGPHAVGVRQQISLLGCANSRLVTGTFSAGRRDAWVSDEHRGWRFLLRRLIGRTASVTTIAMVFTNVYPRRSIAGQEVIAFVGGVKYRTYTQQIRRPDQPSGRRRSTALAAIATGQEHRFSLVIQ